jgi:choline kinase
MSLRAETAVILAAGMGVRMRPLTDDIPKCMAPIKNTTILENALVTLKSSGVKKVFLVCGYKAETLMEYCRSLNVGIDVDFLMNPIFNETNSMYSLKIALEAVKDSCWVIEGDVFFQKDVFPAGFTGASIVWLGDSTYRISGGSYLTTNSEHCLEEISILKSPAEIKPGMLKSVGILGLGSDALPLVSNWLESGLREDKAKLYYDLIFAEHCKETPVRIYDVASSKWAEIDTLEELKEAERLF